MTTTYLGNIELLKQPKTAFLASSTIPTDMVLRCYDWAQQMSREKQCVISGFSSHLEQRVLHFLMKGSGPIVLVLARRLYKHIPKELQPLIDNGRLLIISTSTALRQSRATAFVRNHYVCEQANHIILIEANQESSLAQLRTEFNYKLRELYTDDTQ